MFALKKLGEGDEHRSNIEPTYYYGRCGWALYLLISKLAFHVEPSGVLFEYTYTPILLCLELRQEFYLKAA